MVDSFVSILHCKAGLKLLLLTCYRVVIHSLFFYTVLSLELKQNARITFENVYCKDLYLLLVGT